MHRFVVIIALFQISFCTLSVYSPKELKEQFPDGMPYSVANFGHIPYGQRLIGPLITAIPEDGCSPLSLPDKHPGSPFILLKRDQCSFVTKVKYAQLAGAGLAIIMDNIVEASANITMGDDGLGDSVTIPSIFISEENGQTILTELKKLGQNEYAMIVIDFLLQREKVVKYSFFLNIPSFTGAVLVHDFQKIRKQLQSDKFIFTPRYFFFETATWQQSDKTTNCLGNGQYCCFDPDGPGKANGKKVAQEQLRQICVFQVYNQDAWWNYMEVFHDECGKPQYYLECSQKIVKEILDLDFQKIQDCYDGSFVADSILMLEERENKILDTELSATITSGIIEWPGVSINNFGYRGALEAIDVLEAICSASLTQPQVCMDKFPQDYPNYDNNNNNESGPSITGIVVVVVVILVLFFIFLVFVYRRMVKKELQREMEEKVPSIVSNYIAFHEMNKGQKDNNL